MHSLDQTSFPFANLLDCPTGFSDSAHLFSLCNKSSVVHTCTSVRKLDQLRHSDLREELHDISLCDPFVQISYVQSAKDDKELISVASMRRAAKIPPSQSET